MSAELKRLRRSKQERRRVVEETMKPGASVAVIARAHGVNANQVFHWRKLYREGRLDAAPTQLLPVRINDVIGLRPRAGVIRIELGRARIQIEGAAASSMTPPAGSHADPSTFQNPGAVLLAMPGLVQGNMSGLLDVSVLARDSLVLPYELPPTA